MDLELLRYKYYDDRTIGSLYIDDIFFGHTLEDTVRPFGIKVKKYTAIWEGKYIIQLSLSQRFKRIMPEVLNVPMFTGIRIHGGNRPDDTEGCIIIAKNLLTENNKNIVQGSLEEELTKLLKGPKEIFLTIKNCYQVE